MNRIALIICTAIALGACETTKITQDSKIDVRPITNTAELLQSQTFDANAQLVRAEELQNAADYAASYKAYKTLLLRMDKQHKLRSQALLGLADSALALTWRDEKYAHQARKVYTRISADNTVSQAQKHQADAGLLLLDLSDFAPKTAEHHLQSALQNSPDDPRLWNALGRVHDESANWLDALDAYVKALAVARINNQSITAVVNNMGMSLLVQGRKNEALAKFKQAVKASPAMPVYNNNLRLAQTLSGQTEIALKGLSDTKIAQVYNDAGVIAQAQGKYAKAASFYKKAIEKSPLYFKLAEKNLAGLEASLEVSLEASDEAGVEATTSKNPPDPA